MRKHDSMNEKKNMTKEIKIITLLAHTLHHTAVVHFYDGYMHRWCNFLGGYVLDTLGTRDPCVCVRASVCASFCLSLCGNLFPDGWLFNRG